MASNSDRCTGFTLIELMIVVTIIVTIATVAIPNYLSSLRTARIIKAKVTIRELQVEIELYRTRYGGLPPTLAAVGRGQLLDPWGNSYVYLPYQLISMAGDLVQTTAPSPLPGLSNPDPGSSSGFGSGPSLGSGPGPDPKSIAIAMPVPLAEVSIPAAQPIAPPDYSVQMRRDRNLLPLNSDFDLFSFGPDHLSEPAITALISLDDVIRADDGSYIGVARDF